MSEAIWAIILAFYIDGNLQKREIVASTTKATCEIVRILLAEEFAKAQLHYDKLRVEITECTKSTDIMGEDI